MKSEKTAPSRLIQPWNFRILLLFSITVIIAFTFISKLNAQENYMIGADLSFLKSAEEKGVVFKEDGIAKPGLEIFKDHGYNWIRLRLFHSPDKLPNNLEYTIELAQEAKKLGNQAETYNQAFS